MIQKLQGALDRLRCDLSESLGIPAIQRGVACDEGPPLPRVVDVDQRIETANTGGAVELGNALTPLNLERRSWAIQVSGERAASQSAQRAAAAVFAGADRWKICEIAWMKAFALKLAPILNEPRVQRAIGGLTEAQQTKVLIDRVGQLSGAGAALGTVIPGLGNILGSIAGAVAGVALGLVEWLIAAQDLAEKRRRLLVLIGEVAREVGPVPVPVGLVACHDPTKDLFGRLRRVLIRQELLKREAAKFAAVPAFPWRVDTGNGVRTIGAEDAATAMFTVRERSVGIWPYLEAPTLTWVNQRYGDTPECSGAAAKALDRQSRTGIFTLYLDRLFPSVRPFISADGTFNSIGVAALGDTLIWKNQYTARAVGSQAGVIDASLPCTSFVKVDLRALRNYGKIL